MVLYDAASRYTCEDDFYVYPSSASASIRVSCVFGEIDLRWGAFEEAIMQLR